jgi:hypothetical protein
LASTESEFDERIGNLQRSSWESESVTYRGAHGTFSSSGLITLHPCSISELLVNNKLSDAPYFVLHELQVRVMW